MVAERTTDRQREYYDNFFSDVDIGLSPVERLKQEGRLGALAGLSGGRAFSRALVVGCGTGDDVTALNAKMITALDLSWVAVRFARDERPIASYVQADGMRLPLSSGTFDVVLCSEVIEHVLEPDRLVGEIARVLAPNGLLLLSTPNWVSWWGLARKLGELILRRPITSGGQPVDNWYTTRRLKDTLSRHFVIQSWRGVWYFPPTGLAMRRLPDRLIFPVFRLLVPLDRLLGRLLPGLGHLLAVAAVRRG